MKTEQIDKMIEVLQAFKECKEIESKAFTLPDTYWKVLKEPYWNFEIYEFRIKKTMPQ